MQAWQARSLHRRLQPRFMPQFREILLASSIEIKTILALDKIHRANGLKAYVCMCVQIETEK